MGYWFQWTTSSLACEKDLNSIEDDHVDCAIIEWDYLLVLDFDKITDFPEGDFEIIKKTMNVFDLVEAYWGDGFAYLGLQQQDYQGLERRRDELGNDLVQHGLRH